MAKDAIPVKLVKIEVRMVSDVEGEVTSKDVNIAPYLTFCCGLG